jgi:hypothetical protein
MSLHGLLPEELRRLYKAHQLAAVVASGQTVRVRLLWGPWQTWRQINGRWTPIQTGDPK